METMRFELTTPALQGRCSRLSGVRSSQLSYEPDLLGPSVQEFTNLASQIGLRLNHVIHFL